jgi:hypothetical protein
MTINLDMTSTSMLLDTAPAQVHTAPTTTRHQQPQGIVATIYTPSLDPSLDPA